MRERPARGRVGQPGTPSKLQRHATSIRNFADLARCNRLQNQRMPMLETHEQPEPNRVRGAVARVWGLAGVAAVSAVIGFGVLSSSVLSLSWTPKSATLLATPGVDEPGADTDGDGIADAIELVSGSSPTSVDTDGDGASDLIELLVGTAPSIRRASRARSSTTSRPSGSSATSRAGTSTSTSRHTSPTATSAHSTRLAPSSTRRTSPASARCSST